MLVPVLPVHNARCCFSMCGSQSSAFQRNILSVVWVGTASSGSASPCAPELIVQVIPKLLRGTANIGNYKSSRIPNPTARFLPGLW